MFKVDSKITANVIEKFDDDKNIFYRFQNPEYEIAGQYTQSWGSIFSSADEAIECAEEWGYEKEDAVLPGKSCMDTFEGLMSGNWILQTGDNDVLLVFRGSDTYTTGHDGEFVAEYEEPIAVFSLENAINFYENL